jgi:putative Holliday junction resolvase
MARILCLDYGAKRTGIAVTDPMQIIATALITIETKTLMPFLKNYLQIK